MGHDIVQDRARIVQRLGLCERFGLAFARLVVGEAAGRAAAAVGAGPPISSAGSTKPERSAQASQPCLRMRERSFHHMLGRKTVPVGSNGRVLTVEGSLGRTAWRLVGLRSGLRVVEVRPEPSEQPRGLMACSPSSRVGRQLTSRRAPGDEEVRPHECRLAEQPKREVHQHLTQVVWVARARVPAVRDEPEARV